MVGFLSVQSAPPSIPCEATSATSPESTQQGAGWGTSDACRKGSEFIILRTKVREWVGRILTCTWPGSRSTESPAQASPAPAYSGLPESENSKRSAATTGSSSNQVRNYDTGTSTTLTGLPPVTSPLELAQRTSTRLSALIASSHDAILGVDLNLIVWGANPAVRSLFQVEPERLVGTHVSRIEVQGPRFWEGLRDRVIADEESIQVEALCCGTEEDGRVVWFSVAPVRMGDGTVEGFSVIARDVTDWRESGARLAHSLAEKETLLKEIHHRVKNNLQVISSLLRLQSSYLSDPKAREMFRNSEERVKCMALVHEKLCRAHSLSRVDFRQYVRELSEQLHTSYRDAECQVQLRLNLDEVELPIDRAVPCGLILNEALSNALKYAFKDREQGVVSVTLERHGERVQLVVSDDGCGLSEDVNIKSPTTLGFRVIFTLSEQLRGDVQITRAGGTTISVDFEIEKPKVHGDAYGRDKHPRM